MASFIPFIILSLFSFGASFLMMPAIIRFATKHGIVDRPGGRKQHGKVTPYMGGLGIMLGMLISAIYSGITGPTLQVLLLMTGAITLFSISLIDDIKNIKPLIRLSVQVLSAVLVVLSGIYLPNELPLIGFISTIPAQALTVFVIVALINAFNFMDGVDGLAGGLGFISCGFMGITLLIYGQTAAAILAGSFAAALLAFLYYNVNPARIFMGDCGSTVIGFWVAVFAIMILKNTAMETMHLSAFSVCMLPLVDLVRVSLLRIASKRSPFSGDRNHLHHILLRLKNEARVTSWKIWLAQLILIGSALLMAQWLSLFSGLFALLILTLIAYNWIYFAEDKALKSDLDKTKKASETILKKNPFIGRHTAFKN